MKNILIWEIRLPTAINIVIITAVMRMDIEPASRIVLLFVNPVFHSHRERIAGVYAAATERGWQIQQISEPPTSRCMKTAVKMWNPAGCLLDPSVMTKGVTLRAVENSPVPVVLMGRGEMNLDWNRFDRSFQDCRKPVELAIRELSGLQVTGYAFFGDPSKPYWSVERGRFFRQDLPAGVSFSEYTGPDPSTIRGRKAAARWMRSLPLPCGCLLAADHMAGSFYAAAKEADLKIGIDLLTLGVDDDERICRSLSPRLSSIQLDFFRSGENAVQLLEKRLHNPGLPPQVITYSTLGVTHRMSTAPRFGDQRIVKAMSFIAEHGCETICVNDVAEAMGCSSRLAQMLFAQHVGTSILERIRKVRLEKAYALLRNRAVKIDAIAFQCGYAASPAYLKTYFKRATGMTMSEWRRRYRQLSGI